MKFSGTVSRQVARAWRRAAVARLSGPSLFAKSVLARHGHGQSRAPRLALLLALRARSQHVSVMHRAGNTRLQVALTLHSVTFQNVVGTASRSAPSSGGSDRAPMCRGDTALALAGKNSIPRLREQAMVMALPLVPTAPTGRGQASRLLARALRVESAPSAPGSATRSMPVAVNPPASRSNSDLTRLPGDLPLLQPRPGGFVPPATASQASASESATASPASSRTPPMLPLPPHEIERITERVLGGIDRRILAERERRGGF